MIGDALRSSAALSRRLERELTNWHAREGYSASFAARELARLILSIATQMRTEVDALLARHASGASPAIEDILALNTRALLAERLHTFLDRSSHRSLHPALSPTVRTELEALGVGGHVLVVGTRDVSYEILTLPDGVVSGLLSPDALATFKWPFFIFTVPNEPLDWPLHHVLLYHEIGHALVAARKGLPGLPLPPEYDPTKGTSFEDAVQRASKAEVYTAAANSWLEELYADAVGVLLAGPSYIIAFSRLLGGFFTLDGPTQSHPPLALRIKLQSGVLLAAGFDKAVEAPVQTLLDGWRNVATAWIPAPPVNDVDAILRRLAVDVEKAHEDIISLADSHVGARRYTPASFEDDWRRGDLLASLHVPPIEAEPTPFDDRPSTPLPPSRVFSVCWCAYLACADSDVGAADRFAEAVLGSLEGVEALRVWGRQ